MPQLSNDTLHIFYIIITCYWIHVYHSFSIVKPSFICYNSYYSWGGRINLPPFYFKSYS